MAAIPDPDKVELLSTPYEIYEFPPCEKVRFRVIDWRVGRMVISPRWPGAPPEKKITAIRILVPEDQKKYYPYYWDLTPSRLVGQLISMLQAGIPDRMELEIHRDIAGPRAHFSVRWVPY